MDPHRGMSHQRGNFAMSISRGGRPPMRPAFGGRSFAAGYGGDGDGLHQFGGLHYGGGGPMPMMPYGGYRAPNFPQVYVPSAQEQNRGGGRGTRRTSTKQSFYSSHGFRGGTDISGRGAPLPFVGQNYPVISTFPLNMPPPLVGQQWNGSMQQQQIIFDHRSQQYVPSSSVHQQLQYIPHAYGIPPPLSQPILHFPLTAPAMQWHQDRGTTYYDPAQGYFTDGSVQSVSEPVDIPHYEVVVPENSPCAPQEEVCIPTPLQVCIPVSHPVREGWQASSPSCNDQWEVPTNAPRPVNEPVIPILDPNVQYIETEWKIAQESIPDCSVNNLHVSQPADKIKLHQYHPCSIHDRKPEKSIVNPLMNKPVSKQSDEKSNNLSKRTEILYSVKKIPQKEPTKIEIYIPKSVKDIDKIDTHTPVKTEENNNVQPSAYSYQISQNHNSVSKPVEENNNNMPPKVESELQPLVTASPHSSRRGHQYQGRRDSSRHRNDQSKDREWYSRNRSSPQCTTESLKVEMPSPEPRRKSSPVEDIDFGEMNRRAEEYRRQELAKLTPIIKDVYIEDFYVARMTPQQIKEIRELKNNITVSYVEPDEFTVLAPIITTSSPANRIPIPNPVTTFEQGFRSYPEILEEIKNQGFTEPSPIQCQLWPCIMKGLDVVGIAQTGSGKTLAFLLPALIHIERQQTPREKRNSPTVLVLAPTRELAQQIDKEVKKYHYKNIRSVCLYGGGSRQDQIEAISEQTEIVIATPGRLNDLVQAEKLNLKEVSMLILDEADEMLDQGFEPQINKALLKVRGDRQTILTSATWPASVRRMAQNYTSNPVMVVVGTTDLRAVTSVKQNIVFIEQDDKFDWVVNFTRNMNKMDKAIIFVATKATADHISSELSLKNVNCNCIHGALSQSDREQAIADMQSGVVRIMIATDVASRGIDIDNVTHIINHDFPRTVEQYVHRIGRTGRAGRKGESHTFIVRRDWSSAKELIEILEHAKQEVPQELKDMAERFSNRRDRGGGRGRGGGRRGGNWEDRSHRGGPPGGFEDRWSGFNFEGGLGEGGSYGNRRGGANREDRSFGGRRGGGGRGGGGGFRY